MTILIRTKTFIPGNKFGHADDLDLSDGGRCWGHYCSSFPQLSKKQGVDKWCWWWGRLTAAITAPGKVIGDLWAHRQPRWGGGGGHSSPLPLSTS
ncbi:hypothetical protein CRG98_030830 [Punica granatum]|uniref:Uncharacterized protein n=1 Tax=Punica granatum TaxID=22663 RepID=A0A2I0IXR1_PUNGR|nr:hypothetical protein CRG98_030830 [Punica granatum]